MIDQHALNVLEFDKVRTYIAECATSVYGREAVNDTLPGIDVVDVRMRLALADQMAQAVRWGDPVPMGGLRDIRSALEVAIHIGARLDPTALLSVADTVDAVGRLRNHFESREEKYPLLWDVASALEGAPELSREVGAKIDGSGFVKDSASQKLSRIRRDLDSDRQSLRAGLDRLVNRLGDDVVGDRIVSIRDGRPVIPVRSTHKNSVPGIVHDQSSTGQTLFVEPLEAVEQSNHIRQLEVDELREIERILTEITDMVRGYVPALGTNIQIAAELDRLFAIATFADQVNGVAPRMGENDALELVDMRHPLLDIRLNADSGTGAVPVTARLSEDQRTVLVSGPNAGGKTVALKTIGLACTMAQAGFLIPAAHLTALPVFASIYAEIGDEQSIDQDLSTFSSRMSHLAAIAEQADSDTLILVDELGSATDPEQGAALSRALLGRWAERNARTFATTHLGALKEFAHEHPRAVNASMEFDQDTLSPTFHLHIGIPGSSYALEISRRVGLSAELIERAESELGESVVRTEQLIADVTRQLEDARRQSEELTRREAKLKSREDDYSERFTRINVDRKRMNRESREQAERILSEARALVEKTVADLRSTNASKETVKAARHDIQTGLAEAREAVKKSRPAAEKPPDNLAVGDWVKVRGLGHEGELVSLDKSRAAVQTETARMEVSLEQIERLKRKPSKPAPRSTIPNVGSSVMDTFKTEIDVRGMTFDEAWSVVDKYLDDAVIAQYPRVRIIHGKGTGALRKKFDEQLAQDLRSESHHIGEMHEGGMGVTAVNVRY
jgi:DNA mismatch repair protein MutS2